jgi:hypothetical protein
MKRVLLRLVLLCVGGMTGVTPLCAAKPGGGGGGGGGTPPPAGRIYFDQHFVTYQMSPDGSGKIALDLPSVVPVPGPSIFPVDLLPSSRT